MRSYWNALVGVLALIASILSILSLGVILIGGVGLSQDLLWLIAGIALAFIVGLFSSQLARFLRRLPRTPRVFLSYSSNQTELAHEIAQSLKQAGAHVWVDWEQIAPGEEVSRALRRGMSSSDAFIALVPEEPSQWLQLEFNLAKEYDVKVIPARTGSSSVPDYLQGIYPVNLFPDRDEGIHDLVEAST